MKQPWLIICAHCGRIMPINALLTHYKNKHDWRTNIHGEIDIHSNPMSHNGGNP